MTGCISKNDGNGGKTHNIPKLRLSLSNLFVSIPIVIVIGTIWLAFVIFRQLLSILLKIWYGKRFGGMMSAADAIWMSKRESSPVIHALVVYKSKIKTADEFSAHIHEYARRLFLDDNPNTHTKINGIHKSFLGYTYYLNDMLTENDCHTVLNLDSIDKDYLEDSDLSDILDDCNKMPLPYKNKALWEVVTLSKPLKPDGDAHKYVVIFRVNHAFGDGLSAIYYLFHYIADKRADFVKDMSELVKKFGVGEDSDRGIMKKLKYFFRICYCIACAPIVVFNEQGFRKYTNSLHGPKLSGEKHFVYSTEHPDEHLMEAIRQIKKGVPRATFTGIIATGISRALQTYFITNCKEIPELVIGGTVALLSLPNLNGYPKLENNVCLGPVVLPMLRGRVSIQEQLKEVSEQIELLRDTPYFMVKYLLTVFFIGYFPSPITKFCLDQEVSATFSLSNIPGFPDTPSFGQETKDFYFFTPNLQRIGVGFCVLTYQDKLRIGLVVDKVLVPQKEAVQDLVDNVIKELRLMYEEYKLNNI
ncbi:unnamed protein product [Callosobruchus maculatus]|uniref:O-acyltransferase WSD1 C-terminal domain-containing protein n=1 Tax=Callosobruchus maculatus TaxID=64391 RepID=A0A653BXT9_CALMS|nr:unnamed protein product [Callosobruchus maculatus]